MGNAAENPHIESIRLALRMTPEHLAIYHEVMQGASHADVADEHKLSKQRVGQIMARARDILEQWPSPSDNIRANLDAIAAEACAASGVDNVMQLIDLFEENRVPKWWPAPVVLAICKRLNLPVPGGAALRVANLLMEIQRSTENTVRLIGEASAAVREFEEQERLRTLERLEAENTPDLLSAVKEEAQR